MEGTEPKKDNFLAISILIGAFVIGGSFIYGAGLRSVNDGGAIPPEEEGEELAAPSVDDDVILGDPNAPVTIISFGDYQCPFCGATYRDVEGVLRSKYVETGKARMVYRDFPLDSIHPFAREAAEASECAAEQGKFWIYHDMLFENQPAIPNMDFSARAASLGLDKGRFQACLQSGTYAAEVENDYQDGLAAGVRGTPATFINGKLISGALPLSVFEEAMEEALAKQ